MNSIAIKCKSLKSLDLQACYFADEGLEMIGKSCKLLEELNLRINDTITDRGLVALVKGCAKTLKVLGIGDCNNISDVSLEAIGACCHALECISIESQLVHNKGVCAITSGCPLVKKLSLKCINITNVALITIGMRSPSLQSLSLYTLYGITDDSLACIGEGCKNLRRLKLTNCDFETDRGFERFTSCCTKLADIELNNCKKMGTYWLDCTGGYCQMAKGCKNLTVLRIFKSDEVGNRQIEVLSESCTFLTNLVLHFCDQIGDEALVAVGQGCHFLQHLDVGGCPLVGDRGLKEIAKGCRTLSYLDVSVLQNLHDEGLEEIGKGCPLLKDAIVSYCSKITDVGLAHFVGSCKVLENLQVVHCAAVTADGFDEIISCGKHLKKVLIEKSKVSDQTEKQAGSVITFLCDSL